MSDGGSTSPASCVWSWGQEFQLDVPDGGQSQLQITLWDHAEPIGTVKSFLGEVLLNLAKVIPHEGQHIEQNFDLKQGRRFAGKMPTAKGTLRLHMVFTTGDKQFQAAPLASGTPDPIVASSSPRTTGYDGSDVSHHAPLVVQQAQDVSHHAPLVRFEKVEISQFTGGGVQHDAGTVVPAAGPPSVSSAAAAPIPTQAIADPAGYPPTPLLLLLLLLLPLHLALHSRQLRQKISLANACSRNNETQGCARASERPLCATVVGGGQKAEFSPSVQGIAEPSHLTQLYPSRQALADSHTQFFFSRDFYDEGKRPRWLARSLPPSLPLALALSLSILSLYTYH